MKKELDLNQLENVNGGIAPLMVAGFVLGLAAFNLTGDTRR